MILISVFAILSLVSLGILLFLFIQKYPQLRMLSPDSATDVRDKRKKKEIMRGRLERMGGVYVKKIRQVIIDPVAGIAQGVVRGIAGRLTAAERVYKEKQKIQQASELTSEQIDAWVAEAKSMIAEGEHEKAEKKLIDVIGFDARCIDAYELLGQIYMKRKDYQLAEETFYFLVKLAPKDASVNAYMGEVLVLRDRTKEALAYFEKAIELSPRNPKYLDFFISAAISVQDKDLAEKGVLLLEEANPDNKKLPEFQKQIGTLA